MCKTKLKTSDGRKKSCMDRRVRQVEFQNDDNDDCVYPLGISGDRDCLVDGKISVQMGVIPFTMIIDSDQL